MFIMIKQTLALVGLTLSLSANVFAVTLNVSDTGILLGAYNVDVSGKLYNVEFMSGSLT